MKCHYCDATATRSRKVYVKAYGKEEDVPTCLEHSTDNNSYEDHRKQLLKKVDAEAAALHSFERRVFELTQYHMSDEVSTFTMFKIDLCNELHYAWRHGWTPEQAFNEFVK